MIGYNDTGIHSAIAIFLINEGLFDEARGELEKAMVYNESLSIAHNNWGYYYYKTGNYNRAIESFNMSVKTDPGNDIYHKNLAYALFKSGRKKEAALSFQRSLSINEDQPEIMKFMKKHGLQRIFGR
jgi:tetratricopeptide (TPR) repeat protein